MGKSSWKRRVKETATTTQNSGSSGATRGAGDGGWSFVRGDRKNIKAKQAFFAKDDVNRSAALIIANGGFLGDAPLKCILDADGNCRCIAIEARRGGAGGRRVIRLENIKNMDDEDFMKFRDRLFDFKMDKGLCWSMYGQVALKLVNTRTQDEDELQMIQRQILDKLSFSDEPTTADKKIDQPHAKKANEDNQERQEEKSAKTQGDAKKKKRRKKPKKLTPEEIAVKAAEGMIRRAKKKPPPKKVLRPQDDIQEVPWVQEVLRRRNDWPSCDKKAVLVAATLAENSRLEFDQGPITLRNFVNEFTRLQLYANPEMLNNLAPQRMEELLGEESPVWTKQNMKMIRGLMMAGFTLKPKKADSAGAVGENR